jgi:hypothetical protein
VTADGDDRERSVHRAHAVIRAFVRSASSAAGEDPAALVRLLRYTLPAHFAYEQQPGGLFDALERRGTPVLRLDRLRADHREFLDRLDGLAARLERGEDISVELAAIAERLREHEWMESMSAVQAGMLTPSDAASDDLGVAGLPAEVLADLAGIADHVHGVARERFVARVVVGIPENLPVEVVRAGVEGALSDRGLDFVAVDCCAGDDRVALREVETRRLREG